MSEMNDDLRTVRSNPGSQNGTPAKPVNSVSAGYACLDQAEPGRARRGMRPDVQRSIEGSKFYRPRGR